MTNNTRTLPSIGMVLYRGPSMLNGQPIVAILTGLGSGKSSKNKKTGGMLQTWILPAHVRPTEAARTGTDAAVCGTCPLRPSEGGGCYVTLFHAPLGVWKADQRRRYDRFEPARVRGHRVRFGSYGDPAAVPTMVWAMLARYASGYTGYTHAWRDAAPTLARYCMASADTPALATEAQARGWRTFRVGDTASAGEILCPASEAAGKRTTCERCGLCAGTASAARSIYIPPHGASEARARATVARLEAEAEAEAA